MAHYTFISADGVRRVVKAPMSRAPELARRMARLGWSRLYAADVPNAIIYPTFNEAREESAALADQYDREGWPGDGPVGADVAKQLAAGVRDVLESD